MEQVIGRDAKFTFSCSRLKQNSAHDWKPQGEIVLSWIIFTRADLFEGINLLVGTFLFYFMANQPIKSRP